ncbi:MAG: hypothetical protein LOY03_11525 [Cyclobacteriaceae bacterium]|nr:hypothetical protein [Cyclobacteriaceae bacterium]
MNRHRDHNASIFGRFVRIAVLAFVVALLAAPAYSQERRGDKPVRNSGKLRETRMKSRVKQGDKPRTRDVAGRRVRTRNKSSAVRANSTFPPPKAARAAAKKRDGDRPGKPVAPVMGTRPRDTQKPWSSGVFGRRVNVRSATGKARNVYSNKPQLDHLKMIQREPGDYGRGKKRVVPRSASRAYIRHTSINPIARFSRKHKRGDQARLTDPAGRPPRGRNYRTPPQPLVQPSDPYRGRKRVGDDKPYRGAPRMMSSGIRAPKAWKGDITGRRIRRTDPRTKNEVGTRLSGRIYSSQPRFGDTRIHPRRKGTGYISATEPGEKRPGKAIQGRAPGIGILGVGGVTARTKSRTPLTPHRAGKSRSGKMWNNQGNPLPRKQPSAASLGAGKFQGNMKWREPLTPRRAGKSRSGVLWNNKERAIATKPATATDLRAGSFQGNMKWRPPLTPRRAGKSKSGVLWNNKEQPLPRKPATNTDLRAGAFQGNMRLKRPLKPRNAGESKGRDNWNNDGMPVEGKAPPRSIRTQAIFQGNIKGGRPLTPRNAGTSVSGKLWNNKETPIKSKPPSDVHVAAFRYKGNVRLSRFGRSYVPNPNAADDALKKAKPEKNTFDVAGIRGRTAAYRYVRNPSSSDDALKVREPGRAFARASAYQGNIRMNKFQLFSKSDLHPDSRFIKINKNNVKGEKDALTGFRLWWTRTFKKNDSQPEHLKQKVGKPRYDKGEAGLWYD